MQNSLTFPWPWKTKFFPDCGNPDQYYWTTGCIFLIIGKNSTSLWLTLQHIDTIPCFSPFPLHFLPPPCLFRFPDHFFWLFISWMDSFKHILNFLVCELVIIIVYRNWLGLSEMCCALWQQERGIQMSFILLDRKMREMNKKIPASISILL